MGMPITVQVIDPQVTVNMFDEIFSYFERVDATFSLYKSTSELSRANAGLISPQQWSNDLSTVVQLAEDTKKATCGYFDPRTPQGTYDPTGIVKGWAILNAAIMLRERGYKNFYVDAGGDIEVSGVNQSGEPWRVGIQNPFSRSETVKTVHLTKGGIATSGTYARGNHIYDPLAPDLISQNPVVSLTVIGPNVYEADRFTTAAFAMGEAGIYFVERLKGFEGYQIARNGRATFTSNFNAYTSQR